MANPIQEAWNSGKPLFSRLPGLNDGYTENEPSQWLSAYWDELFVNTREKVEEIPVRQLQPTLCDPEWLDFLAPLYGWDTVHWNPQWSVDAKRVLLANSYSGIGIWENKGTLETLSFVLSTVGIRNFIRVEGDFIIGSSAVGDEIGFQPWEYTIYLSPAYEGTDRLRECIAVDALFGPCYCLRNIVFDPERFKLIELLSTEQDEVLATELEQGLVGRES